MMSMTRRVASKLAMRRVFQRGAIAPLSVQLSNTLNLAGPARFVVLSTGLGPPVKAAPRLVSLRRSR